MNAIILCAGYATRMYPLTENFPKSLLPVAGKPVIDYLMEQLLALEKIEGIHLVTNAIFYDFFEEWSEHWQKFLEKKNVSLQLYDDGSTSNENRLGAAADLDLVLEKLTINSPFFVVAGDNIFLFKTAFFWEKFLEKNCHYVMALPETDPDKLRKTGVLELDENNRIIKLHEKPENPPSELTCPPLYFFQPSAKKHLQEYLHDDEAKDAPGHFVNYLCQKEEVKAFVTEASRLDIGSIESYHAAEEKMSKFKAQQ